MNKKVLVLLPALMMVMASCGGGSGSSTGTSTTSGPVVVEGLQAAYEEAASLESGKESTKQFKFSGVITATTGNSFYVQDNGYGMYVFSNQPIEGASIGQKVEITSTVKNWYGVIETGTIADINFLGAGVMPDPVVITSASQLSGLKQNVLCKTDAKMPSTLPTWSASSDGLPKVTVGSDSITVKFDKNGYNQSKSGVYARSAGHDVHLNNMVTTVYNSVSQFLFCGSSTLELVEVPATSVKLTVSCEQNIEAGTKFTYSTETLPVDTTDITSIEVTEGADNVTIDEDSKTIYTKKSGNFVFKAKAGKVESEPVALKITEEVDPTNTIEIIKAPEKLFVGDVITETDLVTEATTTAGNKKTVEPRYTIKGSKLPYTISELDTGKVIVTATYLDGITATKDITIGQSQKVYGLSCDVVEGGNNKYDGTGTVTQENVSWVVNANLTVDNGWRFGGKSITDKDRFIYSSTAFPSEVTNIDINIGKITIELNSAKLEVYDTLEGASKEVEAEPVSVIELSLKESTLTRVKKPSGVDWNGKYFRIVFNCTNSGSSSNQYVALKSLTFYNNK